MEEAVLATDSFDERDEREDRLDREERVVCDPWEERVLADTASEPRDPREKVSDCCCCML